MASRLQNLLRMASRLPDGGQKIKDQLRQLQEALVTCGNADVTTNTSDSKTASSVRPAFTSHSEGNRVLPTENQRLPPHVLREMYSQSAPGKNLYGGRMTGQRLELVSSVTNEALETLHKYDCYTLLYFTSSSCITSSNHECEVEVFIEI